MMSSKRKTSPLWNHFQQIELKKAKCVHCSRAIAISASSIGSLGRHMKAVHPCININRQAVLFAEEPYDTEAIQTMEEAIYAPVSSTRAQVNRKTTGKNKKQQEDYVTMKKDNTLFKKTQQLDEQLVKMIAKGYHPLRIVDEEEFRKYIALLNPNYKIPTRKILSESLLPKVYNKVFKKVKMQLSKASAICITTEVWTSIANERYITITAHFIDEEDVKLCSVMIGSIQFGENHTSAELSDFLKAKFREWDIENLIGAVVSDNTANDANADIVAAVHLGGWCFISCFAHSINIVMQSSVTKLSDITSKVKHIVQYFHNSEQAAKKLQEIQQEINLDPLKLKDDVPARWNSTYAMLERLYTIKDVVNNTLEFVNHDLILSREDLVIIENAISIMRIFYEVIEDISVENYISASKVIVYCKLINKQIEKYEDHTIQPIKHLINSLKFQLKRRFGEIEKNTLLAEATILDPRFKKNGFANLENFIKAQEELKLKIGMIKLPEMETAKYEPVDSIWEDFDDEVGSTVARNPNSAGIIEFDKYIQEPIIKRSENPLHWWKERKGVYPHVYAYMLNRLNITATSIPCERLFSKAGQILNERRMRLTTKKLTQMMFISCN